MIDSFLFELRNGEDHKVVCLFDVQEEEIGYSF